MMLLFSKILVQIPEKMQKLFCFVFGRVLYYCLASKRAVLLSNLYTVFPDKSDKWRRKLAKLNCYRWAETIWLFFIGSAFNKGDVQGRISLDASARKWFDSMSDSPRPSIVLVPHLNLMEAITWVPACVDNAPTACAVFRQFRNKVLDGWIRKTRERFGLQLISRNRGVAPLQNILAADGIVAILFDQSAGDTGVLATFFDKLASNTDLPGRLAEKTKAEVGYLYIRRTGFGRGTIHYESMQANKDSKSITFESNNWLAKKLKTDSAFYENWLWLHKRWKTQYIPAKRFRIEQKRNFLQESIEFNGLNKLAKKTRIWVRMPNWLGDCIMAIPALRALAISRPDFELNLVINRAFIPIFKKYNVGDVFHALPKRNLWYFWNFVKFSKYYPESYVLLTNSFRGDVESLLTGAPQRFGMKKQWCRPLLTNVWNPANKRTECHQVVLLEEFFKHFGMTCSVTDAPLIIRESKPIASNDEFGFSCFCGSANTPEKRWPMSNWIEFLTKFLAKNNRATCSLLGSSKDYEISSIIASNFSADRVRNLAGKTDVLELERELLNSAFVVSNDTGGMHLANALSVPVIAMYGPTPLYKASPFFNAPHAALVAGDGCMESISPERVITAIRNTIELS